MNFKQHPFSS